MPIDTRLVANVTPLPDDDRVIAAYHACIAAPSTSSVDFLLVGVRNTEGTIYRTFILEARDELDALRAALECAGFACELPEAGNTLDGFDAVFHQP